MDRQKLLFKTKQERKKRIANEVINSIHSLLAEERNKLLMVVQKDIEQSATQQYAQCPQRIKTSNQLTVIIKELSKLQSLHPYISIGMSDNRLRAFGEISKRVTMNPIVYRDLYIGSKRAEVTTQIGIINLTSIASAIYTTEEEINKAIDEDKYDKISELMNYLERVEAHYTKRIKKTVDGINKRYDQLI